jgi:acyl transferase domain-containing protein
MDPQGRLLLEQTGLALGDARARAAAPVPSGAGVYVGVMHMEYIQFMDGASLIS